MRDIISMVLLFGIGYMIGINISEVEFKDEDE